MRKLDVFNLESLILSCCAITNSFGLLNYFLIQCVPKDATPLPAFVLSTGDVTGAESLILTQKLSIQLGRQIINITKHLELVLKEQG